jgi:hypothetical protein
MLCGVETFAWLARSRTLVPLVVMPRGWRIRDLMKSSQLIPLAAATAWPAERNMMF